LLGVRVLGSEGVRDEERGERRKTYRRYILLKGRKGICLSLGSESVRDGVEGGG
jgi:hypothetical protein